jgi:hypothetical protein
MFGSIDLGGDVVEKGGYKKILIESNGLFPILNHHDLTRQIGWNVEIKWKVNYLTPGHLISMLLQYTSAIVLRKCRKTLRQLLNAV